MLILLPPSEGKASPTRGKPLAMDDLSFPELAATRRVVLQHLIATSGHPDGHTLLGVPATLGDQVRANLRLPTAPTRVAGEVYNGVLYDALDLPSLDPAALRRARDRVVVISALWGAVTLRDRIPAYRLSMNTSLPALGPLAAVWRDQLHQVLPQKAGKGLIVDCRSAPYAAAWKPTGDLAKRWVAVRVFQEADGVRTVVSHMAKHTRGLLTRAIVQSGLDPRRPISLVQPLTELLPQATSIELTAPDRAGGPHYLDLTVAGVQPVLRKT